ncbi:uncharacterized protein LOC110929654 isoform X2 [Helianthus annuus]|uniref:Uncharacterized protein n=1 Tax=Helianthus annuus TaxID=4232 RepID=A0A251V884_HELAN|nr:uncharacterized protein LOC110929654 isoform X2 [Helianthus annuus]
MNCYPAAGSLLHSSAISNSIKVFDEMCKWDRASVEIEIVESTFQRRAEDVPSSVSVQGHHWILDPQYPCQIEIYWCSFLIAFKRRTLMPFSLNLSIRMRILQFSCTTHNKY